MLVKYISEFRERKNNLWIVCFISFDIFVLGFYTYNAMQCIFCDNTKCQRIEI